MCHKFDYSYLSEKKLLTLLLTLVEINMNDFKFNVFFEKANQNSLGTSCSHWTINFNCHFFSQYVCMLSTFASNIYLYHYMWNFCQYKYITMGVVTWLVSQNNWHFFFHFKKVGNVWWFWGLSHATNQPVGAWSFDLHLLELNLHKFNQRRVTKTCR